MIKDILLQSCYNKSHKSYYSLILICIVPAKCNFKKIGANVRARAHFLLKNTVFTCFSPLNELEIASGRD